MKFDAFSEKITQVLSLADSKKAGYINHVLINDFPWDLTPDSEMKTVWGRPIAQADVVKDGAILELKSILALCQGRLKNSFQPKRPHRKTQSQVLEEFNKYKPSGNHADITEVYSVLQQSASAIDKWLNLEAVFPKLLEQTISNINTNSGRSFLAQILVGSPVNDKYLLHFLSNHISTQGMGKKAVKIIEEIYHFTLPDLGVISDLLWQNGIWSFLDSPPVPRPGLPVRPEKIRVIESIEQAWSSVGPCYLQPKYYGWQIQIHKSYEKIWVFGRDLTDLSPHLQDLIDTCHSAIKADNAILDGELISPNIENTKTLTFGEMLSAKKHKAVIFDVLLFNDKDSRRQQYQKRKDQLNTILPVANEEINLVEEYYISSEPQLHWHWKHIHTDPKFHGVVLKLPNTPYQSAGLSSGKWKVKNYISLDLVILGYRISTKNLGVFSVGVWSEKKKKFIPIGETDAVKAPPAVNRAILDRCSVLRTDVMPDNVEFNIVPRILVKPEIIVEVVTSGQRVKDERFFNSDYSCLPPYDQKTYFERPDKTLEDINTMEDFLALKVAVGHQEK